MTDLEEAVLKVINKTIDGRYIGKFKVLDEGDKYSLYLYFDRELIPTILSCEGTWKDFLEFIQREFKVRKMEKTSYWKTIREPITDDVLKDVKPDNSWDDV